MAKTSTRTKTFSEKIRSYPARPLPRRDSICTSPLPPSRRLALVCDGTRAYRKRQATLHHVTSDNVALICNVVTYEALRIWSAIPTRRVYNLP
jgi:hypothetical protein